MSAVSLKDLTGQKRLMLLFGYPLNALDCTNFASSGDRQMIILCAMTENGEGEGPRI